MPYTFLYEIHNHLQLIPSTADDIVSHMQYGDNKESFLNFIFFLSTNVLLHKKKDSLNRSCCIINSWTTIKISPTRFPNSLEILTTLWGYMPFYAILFLYCLQWCLLHYFLKLLDCHLGIFSSFWGALLPPFVKLPGHQHYLTTSTIFPWLLIHISMPSPNTSALIR